MLASIGCDHVGQCSQETNGLVHCDRVCKGWISQENLELEAEHPYPTEVSGEADIRIQMLHVAWPIHRDLVVSRVHESCYVSPRVDKQMRGFMNSNFVVCCDHGLMVCYGNRMNGKRSNWLN